MPNKDQHNLIARPPVVVIMGHIDHGKSTLLDYVRKSHIVDGEAGGITQHVGAYQAEHIGAEGKKYLITFLDTPGHAAFCSIRERGAHAADVAILVVSAEDGVKPQTLEAYKNIKAEKIPYIVAINKIDKPNADIDRTKQSLGENEIYVEGWGGDIPCVPISALNGTGVSELLDMVMLVAELADLSFDPNSSAQGTIIESELDTRKGISATLLIKNGTLTTGTVVIAGGAYAPVRFIENFKGEKIESGSASMPVRILGWNTIPACGTDFITVKTKKEAEKMVSEFEAEARRTSSKAAVNVSVKKPEQLGDDKTPQIVTIPFVIKTDVIGSLEGIKHELAKIKQDKVVIKIVSEGIGEINENDVKIAAGDPNLILVGFNAAPDKKAAAMIERSPIPIQIKNFSIIYELTNFIQELVISKIPKEYVEEVTGRAKILAVFSKDKDKQVVGGKVETGTIEIGSDVRIMRREVEIGRGRVRELQQQKKKASEVREGYEFGTLIDAKIEIAPGDRVEAVKTVEKKS